MNGWKSRKLWAFFIAVGTAIGAAATGEIHWSQAIQTILVAAGIYMGANAAQNIVVQK